MATESATISQDEFTRITRPLIGLMIRQVGFSVANTLLAKFGRLTPTVDFRGEPSARGQASVLIEPSWWIEDSSGKIAENTTDSDRLDAIARQFDGMRVSAVDLEGKSPELVLQFDSGWILRCARGWGVPWVLFFDDASLFPKPQPTPDDFNFWLTSKKSRIVLAWSCGDNPYTESH